MSEIYTFDFIIWENMTNIQPPRSHMVAIDSNFLSTQTVFVIVKKQQQWKAIFHIPLLQ